VTDASSSLLLRDAEVDGAISDCLITADTIAVVGRDLGGSDVVIEGHGGALLPGLADHHLHLFAMAAAPRSVDLSGATSYDAVVEAAGRREEIRAVGWDDERLGDLDRDSLDALTGATPTRVQHRSGAMWALNSAALAELDVAAAPGGAERDGSGRLTGKVWRGDEWLRSDGRGFPDLTDVGRQLASYGVTSVTDATPDLDAAALAALVGAVESGAMPQRVHLLGAAAEFRHPQLTVGPQKIVVGDHALPLPDELAATIARAHDSGRAVAIHCVSRAALAVVIAALSTAEPIRGDRIEHVAVAGEAALPELRDLGVVVVTQPSLVARRGTDYLDRHGQDEHADLWRHRSLMLAGIPTVASSDAPYGDPDPWATIRSARDRRTADDRVLGEAEQVAAGETLAGLLAPVADPAGPPRRVVAGGPADLVLLDVPLAEALRDPSAGHVAATIAAGRLVYRR
jgi:predicted amidohydrolase YtcJ